MKNYLSGLFCVIFATTVLAQTPPAGLEGAPFRTWLRDNFYTGKHNTLGYTTARKKMYAYSDNINGKLTCVYGGFQVNNAYGNETTAVAPLNCEHTVPQSFFASADPMVSDMHHLFPAYDTWNNYRGNYPFYEIPDNTTQLWMIGSTSQNTLPTSNIDGYSEYYQSEFEPREAHKGNAARAIAYFFTMYPTEAGPLRRVIDTALLCTWNDLDTVDTNERNRNNKIFQYQGNRNPFIDHPEWVKCIYQNVCN